MMNDPAESPFYCTTNKKIYSGEPVEGYYDFDANVFIPQADIWEYIKPIIQKILDSDSGEFEKEKEQLIDWETSGHYCRTERVSGNEDDFWTI